MADYMNTYKDIHTFVIPSLAAVTAAMDTYTPNASVSRGRMRPYAFFATLPIISHRRATYA